MKGVGVTDRPPAMMTGAKICQQIDDAQQDAPGFGASGLRNVDLRGPASLPQRLILRDRRPLIRSDGERHVTLCSRCLFILCVQIHNIN
jgi:hypothetical protein